MNKIFTSLLKATVLGSLIATIPFTGNAQVSMRDVNQYLDRKDAGKNVSLWNRMEVGYGETFSNGSVNLYTRSYDPTSGKITGSTSGKSFSYRTWSAYAAVYFPLTYIGSNSALVLNTGIYGVDRKSTRLNSSHSDRSRMPSSA